MFSLAEVSMNSIPICEAKLVNPQSFTSLKTDLRLVIQTEVLQLAGALKELFLKGSSPLRP